MDLPLTWTGGKGLPVPMRARPLVQRMRSSGTASDLLVGLERGKMTGRGVLTAMARTMGSVNAPGWAETPTRTVMPAFLTVS